MTDDRSWERDIADSEMGPIVGRGTSRVAHLLLFFIVAFFAIFVIWAYNAELDEVTRGEGKIIPSGQTKVVQHLEGGIISDLLIQEGQEVQAGEVLLRIENRSAEAELEEKRKQSMNLQGQIARLKAEISGAMEIDFPDIVVDTAPDIARQEQSLFEARRSQLAQQVKILANQHQQKLQELNELNARITQLRKSRQIAQKEYDLLKPLVDEGISPILDLYRVEQKLQDLNSEISSVQLAIPRTRTQVAEAKGRVDEKRQAFRTEAQQLLNQVQVEASALEEAITAGVDRAVRTDVRSPVRGTVKQVLKNTIGGVVRPGDDLVEIVPLEDKLLVEARIRPADRAQLWPGLPAVVKVSAYDFSIYGGLDATLVDISPDTITDEQGETFYRIRLRTADTKLGADKPIRTGMTATVDILTGQKTVLDYLMKPILKAKDNALRER
ncbi:HlyD family type I secretion periplasmic adaptor subunit [Aestuariispira insulae]|uniref:Membrane fusion protein (MFP) family protein n=1 Tax=Aestuariispira insulae TaxID=1461337 RepID=A0A3D9HI57_9PROT|nr:HlyD family type I secretion periplasmic adaptor subunit [Aestuariispira insulae]RED49177.1 adhesin transport system membrane fusion protein [Aestuariispira insulae]